MIRKYNRRIATSPNRSLALLVVLLVALAVRVAHVWQLRDTVLFSVLMGDSRGYDTWAQQLAAGEWLGREVFYQAPLYPYFLGVVYAVAGHDVFLVRIVQAFIGALSCVAVGYAAARLVSPRAGLIAGLMLALYPPAIFFDGLIQKSVFDVFLMSVSLALIARIITNGPTPARWLALGVALGALALTRENALVLIAVVAVWAIRIGPKAMKATKTAFVAVRSSVSLVEYLAVLLAGVAMVLLPVATRNYVVGGGFYLTTSQFGSNLYIGNNPRANGSYVALREGRGSPEYERLDATELAEQATGRRLTPGEVSSYWTDQTVAYVRSQPEDWLRLLRRKARLLVSSREIIDTESQESHAEYSTVLRMLAPLWHFGILLPLAVVGVWSLWSERRRLWPLFALTVVYAATVIAFFVVARYRLPLVPMLVVFASRGALAVAEVVRDRSRQRIPMSREGRALVAALVVAIAANWPLHATPTPQAITENNLGAALQESGRHDEAIERYRRALSLDPGYVPAMNNLGTALRAAGRASEAVEVFDKALSIDADRATVYLNRGNALMTQGRIGEAIESFRQAVAIDPPSPQAASALVNALYDQGTAALEAGAFDRASVSLREAIALRPGYAAAHNNLGIALASQGQIAAAVTEWETALRLDPNLEDARRNLELARRKR